MRKCTLKARVSREIGRLLINLLWYDLTLLFMLVKNVIFEISVKFHPYPHLLTDFVIFVRVT